MQKVPITADTTKYPAAFRSYLCGAPVYDSKCRSGAEVLFIDKGCGYYLKSAKGGSLVREAKMTEYFSSLGIGARVVHFESVERDFMLTEKVPGEDLTHEMYLSEPERLVEELARSLRELHDRNCSSCPEKNVLDGYRALALENFKNGTYDKDSFPDSFGYSSPEEAISLIKKYGRYLRADTLIHGDYCLPNVIFNGWSFSGFIDVGNGGIGDRHMDLFWGLWTLWYNLGRTDKYTDRFLDAYGRDKVIPECLRVVAAYEVFM